MDGFEFDERYDAAVIEVYEASEEELNGIIAQAQMIWLMRAETSPTIH